MAVAPGGGVTVGTGVCKPPITVAALPGAGVAVEAWSLIVSVITSRLTGATRVPRGSAL
jgi:hypothetical protein